ncbi:MAG TPA: hypothetical protein VK523_08560 [Steroidobacteraceae bacterium]|nr:hypothetical protein [Steroidobacteraceae bacterium]
MTNKSKFNQGGWQGDSEEDALSGSRAFDHLPDRHGCAPRAQGLLQTLASRLEDGDAETVAQVSGFSLQGVAAQAGSAPLFLDARGHRRRVCAQRRGHGAHRRNKT